MAKAAKGKTTKRKITKQVVDGVAHIHASFTLVPSNRASIIVSINS